MVEVGDFVKTRDGSIFLVVPSHIDNILAGYELTAVNKWHVLFNHDPISFLNKADLPQYDIMLVVRLPGFSMNDAVATIQRGGYHRSKIIFERDKVMGPTTSYSLNKTPAELKKLGAKAEDDRANQNIKIILDEVNRSLNKVLKEISNGKIHDYCYTSFTDNEKYVKAAVKLLVNQGYNAKYEFTEACDDGPNRSSPDYHSIKIIFE